MFIFFFRAFTIEASQCNTFPLTIAQYVHAEELDASAVPVIKVKRTADEAERSEALPALLFPRESADKEEILVSVAHAKREPEFDV